jgi:hypothetical protein
MNTLKPLSKLMVGAALLTASCSCIRAGTLALYPGATLDQQYEKEKVPMGKIVSKQYITADSFEKVTEYYKKLAPEAKEWTLINQHDKRMAFRQKGDEKNSTTVMWSDEDPKDKAKTFIMVNTNQ